MGLLDPKPLTVAAAAATYARKFQVNAADYATPQLASAAVAAGGRLFFPAGTYALTAPIQLTVDNVFIDAPGATFTQATWGQSVFDLLNVSGTVLDIGLCEFIGTRSGVGATFRGSSQYVFGAAVWANRDRTNIRSLRTKNLPVGVHFASWDGVSAFDRVGVNNRIGRLEVEGANFGVLWSGQKALTIDDLYVHDDIDDSAGVNPTHAYYSSAVNTLRGSGVTIKKARAENILYGHAFQLKYTDGASLTGHTAKNCAGLANILDCDDLTWDGMSGTDMRANSNGAVSIQFSTAPSKRPMLTNTSITMATGVDTRAVAIWADDAQINGLTVESNRSAATNTGEWDAIFRGSRGRVRGLTIRSKGAGHARGATFGYGTDVATAWDVEDPVVQASRSVMDALAGSTGIRVRYNPAASTLTGTGAMVGVSGTATGAELSIALPGADALSTFGESPAVNFMAADAVSMAAGGWCTQTLITPRRNISVTSLLWFSTTQSGNYDIAIYDDISGARLWSKGATAWPVAGVVTESVSAVTLYAGRTYRLAFSSDAATGVLRGRFGAVVEMGSRLDGRTVSTGLSASHPLPETLAIGTANGRTPLIIVRGS